MLHFLLKFLKVVSGFSATNFMTTDNLALVVGPNILRYAELVLGSFLMIDLRSLAKWTFWLNRTILAK